MTLKKADRKERVIEIYKMLMIDSADKEQLKAIRSKLACFLGEDTGLFLFDEPIVNKKST
jgi:hypothetical protein